MPEMEPLDNSDNSIHPEEGEKMSMDKELRSLAEKLGFKENERIQAMFESASESKDEREIIEAYENELETLREANPQVDFLAWAALVEAAIHIQSSNFDAAYNNLADAHDILSNEQTYPEALAQIEALMEKMDAENAEKELAFTEGWDDILKSPDAIDYQLQLDNLIDLTQANTAEPWTKNREDLKKRWQMFIERIAYLAITEDDLREMTPSEIVETALITLTTNLETIGWAEEGISLEIPDLATGGEPVLLDITKLKA